MSNSTTSRILSRSIARATKHAALACTSLVPIAFAVVPAYAQTAPAQTAQAPAVEEIVVTGTRVQRDGYEAPTPLTVIGVEQIEANAPTNLADFVNQMPEITGSATPQTSNSSISSGTAGVNTLNIRGLGAVRTLVLLAGQRTVGSVITGEAHVNTFPQALVSRVDVVTGGASAAYGSDALSGVVNFVLDKKFTGFKMEYEFGVTTYGDGPNHKVSATAGQDTVHPEGIAYDPTTGNVFWADEGANNTLLAIDPTVREAGTDGSYVATLPVSGALHSTGTSGIRDGEGLSGVAFSSNGQVAVSTVAGPLLQDGPNPTATTGGYARIVLQNRLLGFRPLAQYAYPLDALPLTDANGNGTNEIADILPVDTTHYLVLEHGTAAGKGNSVRLYEIDTTNATNVTTLTSLAGATFTPVSKTLLVDFATLHLGNVANFSGLTWGPTLPNGEKTLVLVSDNNFDSHTSTQFLALAVSGL